MHAIWDAFHTCWCKISKIESYHNVSHAVGSPKTPAQTTLRSTALAFGVYISSAAYWKPYAEDGHGREAISGEARPHRESAFAVRKRSDAKDRKHSEVSALAKNPESLS